MSVALLDTVGTWQEISEQLSALPPGRLRVIALPAPSEPGQTAGPGPIADVLAQIAAEMTPADLALIPGDLTDNIDRYVYGSRE